MKITSIAVATSLVLSISGCAQDPALVELKRNLDAMPDPQNDQELQVQCSALAYEGRKIDMESMQTINATVFYQAELMRNTLRIAAIIKKLKALGCPDSYRPSLR